MCCGAVAVRFFALTAGTTGSSGNTSRVTDDTALPFPRRGFDALLYYTARIGHASVFERRHLFLGGSTALSPIAESAPHHAYVGNLGGVTAPEPAAVGGEAPV